MRIYFAGAYGEGKTSLKTVISKKYSLTPIPEQVRILAEEQGITLSKLRINPSEAERFQQQTFQKQYETELLLKDNFVSCRCIDIAAFMGFFGSQNSLYRLKESPLYKDYVRWLKEPNVLIFYMLSHKSIISNDNFRDTDPELALQISGGVRMLLELEGINYIPIHPLNAADREKIIFNYININLVKNIFASI